MSDPKQAPTSESHHPEGHDPHEHHAVPLKTYVNVFAALCVLTLASFLTYTDLWHSVFSDQVGWAFMMAVACTKAMLVILFFMHLKYEANWKYVLTIPAAFMSVFLVLMLVPDIGRRTYRYSVERWEHASEYDGAAWYISRLRPLPDPEADRDGNGRFIQAGGEHDPDQQAPQVEPAPVEN